jgi:hypothetical protein
LAIAALICFASPLVYPIANISRTVLETHPGGFACSQELHGGQICEHKLLQVEDDPNRAGFQTEQSPQLFNIFWFYAAAQPEHNLSVRGSANPKHDALLAVAAIQ